MSRNTKSINYELLGTHEYDLELMAVEPEVVPKWVGWICVFLLLGMWGIPFILALLCSPLLWRFNLA